MSRRILGIVGLALMATLAGLPRAAAAGQSAGSLAVGEQLYAAGDYDGASQQINELLARDGTLPAAERARAYLMKARLELAYGRQAEIHLWLAKACQANPQLTLDPVKDPPSLIAAWRELRKHQTQTAARAEAQESPGRFLAGLLPFGLGHVEAGRPKDGALFLSAESLALLAAATLPRGEDDHADHPRAHRLGAGLLLGLYGYELVDLLPELTAYEPSWASGLSYGLSFAPFGVAQAKNHEPVKAAALAAVDAVLLTAATMGTDDAQRRAALGLLGVAWVYGIVDGLLNHGSAGAPGSSVGLAPMPGGGMVATIGMPL
jgi:hypothetical protein